MAKNQSSKYSKEFLDKTIKVWQPYFPDPLSLKDAREIIDNMTALFNFLIKHNLIFRITALNIVVNKRNYFLLETG